MQLNYSTNIHLLIPRFMKSLCVVTKLNTLTDVPYQMTVGGAFVYVCENMWKRLEQRSRVYNAICYNGVAVYKSISTHTYIIGLPDAKFVYTQSVSLAHQRYAFSGVSLFWSHNGTQIQFNFCSAHVRTFTRDVTW